MDLVIRKLTAARVEDFFDFFDKIAFADHPEWGCECYCCFYHAVSAQEWQDRTAAENQALARKMILAGSMQGLLAYADGRPAGWCHYDSKDRLPGLPVFSPAVMDPEPTGNSAIGAIVCFTIAQGCRNLGIAGRLLDAACIDLAAQGYESAEAYPLRNYDSAEENYHGPLAMFLSRGFAIIREAGRQVVVRKTLSVAK
jgi:hypothetical protein